MGCSFRLAARDLLYAPSHRQDNTYHGFVDPVVVHWLEREITQWVHHKGSIQPPIAPWADALVQTGWLFSTIYLYIFADIFGYIFDEYILSHDNISAMTSVGKSLQPMPMCGYTDTPEWNFSTDVIRFISHVLH